MYGALGTARNNLSSGASISNMYGVSGISSNSNGGLIQRMIGTDGRVRTLAGGSAASAYGLFGEVTHSGAGTITNSFGLYVSTVDGTNKWGIYQAMPSNSNYFAGNVGIGTTSPAASLDVNGSLFVRSSFEGTSASTDSTASYTIPNTSVNVRRINLTANSTITLPAFAAPAGAVYTVTVVLKQDATGGWTATFAGNGGDTVKWDSGVAPTISSGIGKTTIVQFTKFSDEAVWYGSMVWRED